MYSSIGSQLPIPLLMANTYVWQTVWWILACAAMVLGFITQGGAQWEAPRSLSASATVRLTAFKPSSISVSVHEVPLAFDFQPNAANLSLAIPVTTTWNVNPLEVRGVEVVAYFANPEHALTSPESASIRALRSWKSGRKLLSPLRREQQAGTG
jgi:hypothetical protein